MIPIYKFEQRLRNSIREQVPGQVKVRFYKQKSHRPCRDDDWKVKSKRKPSYHRLYPQSKS
jgi:hypothetical protein